MLCFPLLRYIRACMVSPSWFLCGNQLGRPAVAGKQIPEDTGTNFETLRNPEEKEFKIYKTKKKYPPVAKRYRATNMKGNPITNVIPTP